MLALQALTIHNVYFMNELLRNIREAMRTDTLDIQKKKWAGV